MLWLGMFNSDNNEFQQRKALQEFHQLATQEQIEVIADDLFIRQLEISEPLAELTNLACIFDNSSGIQAEALEHFFGNALRRRDADFLNMVADEMYAPGLQQSNTLFVAKMKEIESGNAKPALRPVG